MLHPLFGAQIAQSGQDKLHPDIADVLWTMAETAGDTDALVTLLNNAATAKIRAAAVKRKEVPIRIAYLCHPQTTNDERAELLEHERRADVFAGLIQAARQDDAVKDRLAAQLKARPTKALAKAMINGGFDHAETMVSCIKLLHTTKLSDPQTDRLHRLIRRHSKDAAWRPELIETLQVPHLLEINTEQLTAAEQARYAQKLTGWLAEHAAGGRPSWETMRTIAATERALVALCDHPDLDPDVATELMALEDAPHVSVDTRGKVSAVLCARGVTTETAITGGGALVERALTANGEELERLVRYLLDSGTANQEMVEALLCNPALLTHPEAVEVMDTAQTRALRAAMNRTRSATLFRALFHVHGDTFANTSWDLLDNPQQTAIDLLVELGHTQHTKSRNRYYGGAKEALYLLERFKDPEVLLATPWPVLEPLLRGWNSHHMISVIGERLQTLQRDRLGVTDADIGKWHQFGTLAGDWSGTVDELLYAAANL